MLLPVFIIEWMIESYCDPPPSVGDEVSWRLAFDEHDEAPHPLRRGSVRLACSASPFTWPGQTLNPYAVHLECGGVHLYWDSRHPQSGPLVVEGYVYADYDGYTPDDFPTTRGIVRGVEVEECDYNRDVDGGVEVYTLAKTQPRYRAVTTSPKWFRTPDLTAETGIVVTLETS